MRVMQCARERIHKHPGAINPSLRAKSFKDRHLFCYFVRIKFLGKYRVRKRRSGLKDFFGRCAYAFGALKIGRESSESSGQVFDIVKKFIADYRQLGLVPVYGSFNLQPE